MKKKGQTGVIIIVILIIIVAAFFLFKEGYIHLGPTTTVTTSSSVNPFLPISLNITSATPLAHLYTNEQINVISTISNDRDSYINVVLLPYGCSFLPIQNKSVSIPPDSPSSIQWNFSSSSSTTCTITFSACFNAVSYTNYPLTIESYKFTGAVPVSPISSSSGVPIALELLSFNTTIVAAPSPYNQTAYLDGNVLTSSGLSSKLNWVQINIQNGKGYFTSSTGKIYDINPSINLTDQQYQLLIQNGRLLAPVPFSLLINPVSNSLGYTSNVDINVSAGYTYCIQSNSIPISIS